ncbi:hypothetical protein CR513_57399, partial [Mucuna pruriens]
PADGSYVFDVDPEIVSEDDSTCDELSERVNSAGRGYEVIRSTNSDDVDAKASSYLAASLLRLFTKSDENYVRAFNHITSNYQNFYGTSFPMTVAQLTIEGIRTLIHLFSHQRILKNTLFKFLYSNGGSTKAEGMRKFLFDLHLANTGMHFVSIFIRLCSKMNCPPGLVLTILDAPEYERQVNCMLSMLHLITRTDEGHQKKMWKYGRIFNDAFMAPLQTKACSGFVYTLACALKKESSQSNQNILNIAQFSDLSDDRKRIYEAMGEGLLRSIRSITASADAPPIFSILRNA